MRHHAPSTGDEAATRQGSTQEESEESHNTLCALGAASHTIGAQIDRHYYQGAQVDDPQEVTVGGDMRFALLGQAIWESMAKGGRRPTGQATK